MTFFKYIFDAQDRFCELEAEIRESMRVLEEENRRLKETIRRLELEKAALIRLWKGQPS